MHTLPKWNLPLTICLAPKGKFIFQPPFFRGYFNLRGCTYNFCWPLLGARWKLHQRIRARFLASLLHWTYQLVMQSLASSVFCCKTQPDVIPNVRIHFVFVMKHACLCEMSTGFDREQVVWNLASSTLPWPKNQLIRSAEGNQIWFQNVPNFLTPKTNMYHVTRK